MTLCRHFGSCGGCSFQDIDYEMQLENKILKLKEAADLNTIDIIASPRKFGFRNKMEYSFETSSLGLHPRGVFREVIDLKECPVFSEWIAALLEHIRDFSAQYSVPYYNRPEKSGILRYLIVRESKFSGDKMLVLVVDGLEFKYENELIAHLKTFRPEITSLFIAYRHRSGDTALSEDYRCIYGKEYLDMRVGKISVDVSAYSFFQPNSFTVEKMYEVIRTSIGEGSRVLDLFCGVGTISLFIADKAASVTGVENFPSCIEDAKRNREKNSCSERVNFISCGVKQFISSMDEDYDYIILDPPRSGVSYRIWKHLIRYSMEHKSLKKIIYVSCSQKNLHADLEYIRNNSSWSIDRVTAVDQFVHTPHLEVIVELDVR